MPAWTLIWDTMSNVHTYIRSASNYNTRKNISKHSGGETASYSLPKLAVIKKKNRYAGRGKERRGGGGWREFAYEGQYSRRNIVVIYLTIYSEYIWIFRDARESAIFAKKFARTKRTCGRYEAFASAS